MISSARIKFAKIGPLRISNSWFFAGRHFVTPDDVKAIASAVLRHRITLSYQAEADGITTDNVIETILRTIPAP